MNYGKLNRILATGLALIWLLTAAARAQNATDNTGDLETDRVQTMIRQAWQESAEFIKASGKSGDTPQAIAAFQTSVAEHPNSLYTREAGDNSPEADLLNIGQPAPQFTFRSITGEVISPANFKGRAVLLVFWASWCGPCVGEIPLLKELYAKHRDQGLAVIGISLDDNPQALQSMVASKGLAWPQIRAGKTGELVKLFNVTRTPTHYLLDRDGKIAANGVQAARLNETITGLLKK